MVGRDVGVEPGAAEEVASYFRLERKMVPQLEREVDVSGTQSTDEVIFESLDGSFCSIDAMIVGFDELDGTVAGGDKCFDGSRGLIVRYIEGGSKSFVCEGVKDCGEGCDDVVTLCGRYRAGKDVVNVVVICNEEKLLIVQRSCG
jgi:hypothetical protein